MSERNKPGGKCSLPPSSWLEVARGPSFETDVVWSLGRIIGSHYTKAEPVVEMHRIEFEQSDDMFESVQLDLASTVWREISIGPAAEKPMIGSTVEILCVLEEFVPARKFWYSGGISKMVTSEGVDGFILNDDDGVGPYHKVIFDGMGVDPTVRKNECTPVATPDIGMSCTHALSSLHRSGLRLDATFRHSPARLVRSRAARTTTRTSCQTLAAPTRVRSAGEAGWGCNCLKLRPGSKCTSCSQRRSGG